LGKIKIRYQSVTKIMAQINPWINFNGNAKEAFDFYQSVFGGEFAKVQLGVMAWINRLSLQE
jgi:predicted enzyme related to lactoylglutathione lyase